MAQGISKRDWKALYPLRYIANLFKEQTLSQLEINMMTQRVFPYAPYSAYPEVNEYRRQHGGWYSKDEGNGSPEMRQTLDSLSQTVAALSATVLQLQKNGIQAKIQKYGSGGLIDEVQSGLKFASKYK